MSTPHTFDLESFKTSFPALATVAPASLGAYFTDATVFLGVYDGCLLSGDVLQRCLNLLTAHLAQTSNLLLSGQSQVAPIASATQGSVSLSMVPPPATSGWQYWLASTPYGQQLWALLSMRGAGGFLIGGSLERKAFRKAGGVF